MKKKMSALIPLALVSSLLTDARAEIVAYPQKGQSEQQQMKDKGYCSQWAQKQTGVTPEAMAQQESQTTQGQPKAGAGRGAAKGATAGVVGGAIGGDAGKGAAIGAGVGATGGAIRRRKQEKAATEQAQQGQAKDQQQLASYEKAQKACLQGKGYSVQ